VNCLKQAEGRCRGPRLTKPISLKGNKKSKIVSDEEGLSSKVVENVGFFRGHLKKKGDLLVEDYAVEKRGAIAPAKGIGRESSQDPAMNEGKNEKSPGGQLKGIATAHLEIKGR